MHTQTQVPASYNYHHKLCSQKHSHTWGWTIRAETCIVTQPCILAMQVPMSAVSCHWHTEVIPTWTLWTYSWKPLLENSLLECLQLNSFIIGSTKKGGLCRWTRPGERREAVPERLVSSPCSLSSDVGLRVAVTGCSSAHLLRSKDFPPAKSNYHQLFFFLISFLFLDISFHLVKRPFPKDTVLAWFPTSLLLRALSSHISQQATSWWDFPKVLMLFSW